MSCRLPFCVLLIFYTLRVRINLARLALANQQAETALAYAHQSLEIVQNREINPSSMVNIFDVLGFCYLLRGDLEEAKRYFQRMHDRAQDAGYQRGIALSLVHLAIVYYQQDNLTEAQETIEAGLRLFHNQGNQIDFARALVKLGDILLASNDVEKARTTYRDAALLSMKVGAQTVLCDAALGLARLFQQIGKLMTSLQIINNLTPLDLPPHAQNTLDDLKGTLGDAANHPVKPVTLEVLIHSC